MSMVNLVDMTVLIISIFLVTLLALFVFSLSKAAALGDAISDRLYSERMKSEDSDDKS